MQKNETDTPPGPLERKHRQLIIAWLVFLATFPLGLAGGALLGLGADRESWGIAMNLSTIAVGLLGTIPSAISVSYFTIKCVTGFWPKLHAIWPWLVILLYFFFWASGLRADFLDAL